MHPIPELDRKGLRSFGITTGVILAAIFGLFFPWLLDRPIPRWPWVIAGALVLMGLAAPMALNPVYKIWMRFGLLMSRIMTPIIMGIVFYVVITPVALLVKLLGKDAMRRRLERDTATYRIPSDPIPPERLDKPF
jgi:MFS family permease